MPVTSPLFIRWRARGKAARMKEMDFSHPDLARPGSTGAIGVHAGGPTA
ncbi:hypothetical protein Aros01_04890 [Streptosporangium roseum]|uniref:Uncharacterized protein n=1 Tax=Streptosporangium roseum (strain ATCC 12428 / DSM 43021 / JCM 3005 / KCTC 9067 / NCIMB 10171 / NRRL 2505 / NI 9100) TaxID=479432 RepID=D2AX10_STRRD|nr:hypothetical protein Sros_6209 [Streptosporangium roseum DSM 43021]